MFGEGCQALLPQPRALRHLSPTAKALSSLPRGRNEGHGASQPMQSREFREAGAGAPQSFGTFCPRCWSQSLLQFYIYEPVPGDC